VNYFVDASTFLLEYIRRNAMEIFGNKKRWQYFFAALMMRPSKVFYTNTF